MDTYEQRKLEMDQWQHDQDDDKANSLDASLFYKEDGVDGIKDIMNDVFNEIIEDALEKNEDLNNDVFEIDFGKFRFYQVDRK